MLRYCFSSYGRPHLLSPAQLLGTHWAMISVVRRLALTVLDVCLKLLTYFLRASTTKSYRGDYRQARIQFSRPVASSVSETEIAVLCQGDLTMMVGWCEPAAMLRSVRYVRRCNWQSATTRRRSIDWRAWLRTQRAMPAAGTRDPGLGPGLSRRDNFRSRRRVRCRTITFNRFRVTEQP